MNLFYFFGDNCNGIYNWKFGKVILTEIIHKCKQIYNRTEGMHIDLSHLIYLQAIALAVKN